MLVDSHCHLDFPALAEDRGAVVARARAAGVQVMQTIGTKLGTFEEVLRIAEADPDIYCSVGIHPHRAAKEPLENAQALLHHAAHPKVIGIGESGLDFFHMNSPKADQERVFRLHIEAARESGLPLIVHTRDADEDTLRVLEQELAKGRFAAVIHCYSSSPALGRRAVELGFYLGLGGILTFRRSDELRATVAELPLERLLLETDAPYLAPEPHRGKRNEPAHVTHVATKLAEVKKTGVAEVERVTTAAFFTLFAKASAPDGVACG